MADDRAYGFKNMEHCKDVCCMTMERKLLKLLILLLMVSLWIGCAEKQKEEKIDLEKIKEQREGLDYRGRSQENFFTQLDELLKKWHAAQRTQDHPVLVHIEAELGELSRSYFSELVKAIPTNNGYIAVAALGFSNDIRAIPYLLDAMKQGDVPTRANAALAIGHIASDQTPMKVLFETLEKDPADEVRGMAAFAIAQIVSKEKDHESLPYLLKALQDRSLSVRNHAVIAIEKIGNKEGGKAILSTTLQDEHPLVRYNSIRAVSTLCDEAEAKIPLIKRLRDSVQDVREAAYLVLQKITGKDFGLHPDRWEEWAEMKPKSK